MTKYSTIRLDEDLLQQMINGEEDAFKEIFLMCYKPLCAYAYRYVSLEDAEEIVQDLMVWLWKNHGKFAIDYDLFSYLIKATYLRCISRIRHNAAKQRIEQTYGKDVYLKLSSDFSDFQTEDIIRNIHEAINRLPNKYREAFVLHKLNGKSYKEIAVQLGISPKTVDYRIQQALNILRKDLKNYSPLFFLLLRIYSA